MMVEDDLEGEIVEVENVVERIREGPKETEFLRNFHIQNSLNS